MTQEQLILNYLREGHTLTPLEGLQMFGTMRLGARCFDLRKQGHDVHSRMVRLPSGKRVAEYYIPKEIQKTLV